MSRVVSISEAASIALHGMILIARNKNLVNVNEISEATNTSRHHVAKVFQRLVKEGYLSSHRGPSGGFSLKKKPEEINFLEIYEAIEGKLEVTKCPLDKQICPFDRCLMNNTTNRMTNDFKKYLSEQTLNQYI
jgi:Rrf2 family protein